MRRLLVVSLIGSIGLVTAVDAHAATQAKPPAGSSAPQTTPPPATPPQPATPAQTDTEEARSLFEPTWRQFEFGGRLSSVDGDPARFQRYRDIRDGVLFTDARYANADPEGAWSYRFGADNVGWRDQRFFGEYGRTGRFVVTGLWDEIPQFYSVDTRTPFTGAGGTLVLDDAAQRSIQNSQATLDAYVPLAPQFDLRERRDIGQVGFRRRRRLRST